MISDGLPAENIAKGNGKNWDPIKPGLDFNSHAMVIYKNELYAAGGFMNSESDVVGKEMIAKIPISAMIEINK